jgi:thioesterase domain-containing protein
VRTPGSEAPLFIIHAGDGEVGYAFKLAPHLPLRHPVYALAALGFAEHETPLAGVEAMASAHLRAMRSVQPHGPYRLIGWSAGGMIAYEIATQLLAVGESVAFVGVIDTLSEYSLILGVAGEGPSEAQILERHVREAFGQEVAERLAVHVQQGDVEAVFDLCQRQGVIDAAIERATLRRHLAVRRVITMSLAGYRPKPIDVPLAVFTAAQEERPDARLGWQDLVGPGVHVVELPGTHWTIVDEHHVGLLGEAISQALGARLRGGTARREGVPGESVC